MSQQPQLITYSFNNHQIVAGHAVQANVVMANHQGGQGGLLHQPNNLVMTSQHAPLMTINMAQAHQAQIHMTSQTPVVAPHPRCDICNFTDPSKAVVLQHIRNTHYQERYETQPDERMHIQQIQILPVNREVDHENQDVNQQPSSFRRGRGGKTKTGKLKNRPHMCETCNSTFAQKIHLDTHIKNVHCREKPYSCQYCEYCTANKGSLDKHVKIVHQRIRPFKCPICETAFGQKVHLDAHISAVHNQERPFKCENCHYKATTKGLLDKHQRTVHNKEKPFACQICMSRFGQKAHLQKHVITVHRREKPYKCDSCAYQSSTKSTLHKHIAVIHHKDKPFRCQLCPNSTFGQKTHLDNHIKQVHNIPNPYKCIQCESSFATAGNLKMHVKIEHEDRIVIPTFTLPPYQGFLQQANGQ